MKMINYRTPELLIGNYENFNNINEFIDKIVFSDYSCINDDIPICRYRGTFIEPIKNNKFNIVAWQRNIARIKRMDVSLPTIINITLSDTGTIEYINLEPSFKGSRGLFCSQKYLNRNLKKTLAGSKIDKNFINLIKTENLHCFHLTEVLGSVFSYYNLFKNESFKNNAYFFDEEVTDSYDIHDDLIAVGIQRIKNFPDLKYTMVFKDIYQKTTFSQKGFLNVLENMEVDFFINDQIILKNTIKPTISEISYINFFRILKKCVIEISKYLYNNKTYKLLNTNLYPAAYIGLFVQALALKIYRNNYDYTMHVLASIQRKNGNPLCIGAINNIDEANQYFPEFDITEII